MLNIALFDDGTKIVDFIEKVTLEFFNGEFIPLNIIRFKNANNLLYDIADGYKFDLFLLEAVLPDMSGEELIKKVRKTNPNGYFVFITSQLNYAIDGYGLKLFRFIPKDEVSRKLISVLRDFKYEVSLKDRNSYIITTNIRLEKLPYKNIYYIYKEKKYSIFVTTEGKSKERKGIAEVYNSLNRDEFFFIDKGYIVHAFYVSKLIKNNLYLLNGIVLTVSRTHIKEIRKKLIQYWKNNYRKENHYEQCV
ncbi:LytR/AlgR family response regulator transcription factor [Lacrimispora sp. 38-1]|uniref:LytR/AlgR family response regulator transcription factor n=1 Tax=Lacrimispora sp. 38-1 TaxID=3125778 RepID=UPI003CF81B9F